MAKKNPSTEEALSPSHVEKELLPRLKFMGYLMTAFCIAAFLFALLAEREPAPPPAAILERYPPLKTSGPTLMADEELLELRPTEVLNFYVVSLTFFLVGASCFLIAWKKKKTLQ
jgi:hypothetical protein